MSAYHFKTNPIKDIQNKEKASNHEECVDKPNPLESIKLTADTKLRFIQKKLETYTNKLNQLFKESIIENKNSQMATIFALAKLAETRDSETGDHLKRVQIFCKLIAEKMSLNSNYTDRLDVRDIDNIQKASTLHDIGKVGISDSILLKPDRLTMDEYDAMKRHTDIGADTLEAVDQKFPGNDVIKTGIQIARSHHEKWDGSGYPEGLSEENIPLPAQIMAFVDVYDALRSKRIYKEAYSNTKTREIIVEGSGKHFNPLIVNVYLEFENEFDQMYSAVNY